MPQACDARRVEEHTSERETKLDPRKLAPLQAKALRWALALTASKWVTDGYTVVKAP